MSLLSLKPPDSVFRRGSHPKILSWALHVAWEHPRCEVRGIDVAPHHHNPEESLENVYLDVDDLNMPFQFPHNHFDIINSRLVAGGINRDRWAGYLRDIFESLRPGGWVQMVEIDFNAQSDNGALEDSKFSTSAVVTIILIRNGAIQEPKSATTARQLAYKCWIHRRRRANDATANVCLVDESKRV
ncbi:hypothetical protein GGR50DRAFT_117982 [Xylaria sp. CBS 124048]|nr:hypothetical protein GGR50DRAFT_117982 [Xylaria sp. CBS 124048]